MENDSRGDSPGSATAEQTSGDTTPVLRDTGSSLEPTQEADIQSRVAKASNPADVMQLLKDVRKAPTGVDHLAVKPTAEETEEGETPAKEEAPESEAREEAPEAKEAAEETQPVKEPAEETETEEDEGDSPVTPSTAKKLRLRLPEKDQVGRLATEFLRRNRDWNMEQAVDAAKTQLGVKPSKVEAAPDVPAKPKSDMPETVDAVDAKIAELEAEELKAADELRTVDQTKIQQQLRKLGRHRDTLEREAIQSRTQQEQQQRVAYDTTFSASEAKAIELYPDAGKPESAFAKRMVEIEAALEEAGSPVFHDADKPKIIANMAAKELGIAPKRKGQPAAPVSKPAATPPPPAPKKNVLPGGGSRTATPSEDPNGEMAAIAAARTPQELKALYKKAGIRGIL